MQTEIGNRQIQSVIAGLVAGAGWGQSFIAEQALPPVNTYGENFIYETWGNEGLEDVGSAKRGLNASTKELDPPKNSSVSATLDEYALQTKIDYRVKDAAEIQDKLRSAFAPAEGMSAVDRLRYGRALRLQYAIQIQKEKAAATLLFTNTNYQAAISYGAGLGLAAVDFTAAGLIGKVQTAKRAVARLYGFEPDTFVLGYQKFLDLWVNTDVLARITGGANNTNPAVVNFELLAALFGVKRFLVGSAISQSIEAPGTDPTAATDLWTTTTAALVYTGEFATADLSSPAFGKTFYKDVPETGVRYDVRTWNSDNNKLEFLEATEFFKIAQVMKAGVIFTA